jgi:hypothetical protein
VLGKGLNKTIAMKLQVLCHSGERPTLYQEVFKPKLAMVNSLKNMKLDPFHVEREKINARRCSCLNEYIV